MNECESQDNKESENLAKSARRFKTPFLILDGIN